MRLTVGPLPAAVYWRRRLVVAVGVAIVVMVVVLSCQGGQAPAVDAAATTPTTSLSASPSASVTASATDPVNPTTSPTPSDAPSLNSATTVVDEPSGPCTDAELELTVSASDAKYFHGTIVVFTLKVRNISSRTCTRDIGGAVQEIQLRKHGSDAVVWSSDDCGGDITTHWNQTFAPGTLRSFDRNWNGFFTRSDSGKTCVESDNTRLAVGLYDLVARLDQKTSVLVTIEVSSTRA